MKTTLRHKEIIRGKILYYLALIYPHTATLPLLQAELDIFGFPVTTDQLTFHLAYLDEKGFVAVEKVRGPETARLVPLAKITAKAIDYFDGRLPVDEGVYLEPKS